MAKKLLITGGAHGPLTLSLDGDCISLGADAVLEGLRVLRVHCELEVEGEPECGGAVLPAGEDLRLGNGTVHLEADPTPPAPPAEPPGPAAERPPAAPPPLAPGQVRKQLRVVDGPDQGRRHYLPEFGRCPVGKSPKYAEIVLHDLDVARVHCELEVVGDRVYVSHVEGERGTIVNGKKVAGKQELHPGDVLKVGNTHLRFELVSGDERGAEQKPRPADAPAEPARLPNLPADRLNELEGHVLGNYRLRVLLGRGHSGVVFKAEDVRNESPIGLKVLSPEFPSAASELLQFAKAIKAAPQYQHPNLLPVYGAGKAGLYTWIARELVDGEPASAPIHRLAEGGRFNWQRAARVALHLARALGYLHERRVVHGNVTPANVLLRASDKQTKLADLLLNKALEGSQLQQAVLEKKLLTELPYLAPEQVEPDAFVDQLADLYALGAVTYGLLTGRPPYQGATPEETLTLITEAKLVKPSRHQRGIPPDLEAVVVKLLARHQEDRYGTANELLADLEPLAQRHGLESDPVRGPAMP